jgi:cell wall-associated NlpC family hydrolase
MKRVLLFSLIPLFPLSAQSVSVGASRWLTSPGISEYRLGMDGFAAGPFVFRHAVQLIQRGGESSAAWGGVGSDGILRLTRDARPYLIGGAGLGLGRPDSLGGLGPALGLWAGVGAELLTVGPIGLQAEALYTWRGRMQAQSISLGFRAGMKIGGPSGRQDGRAAGRQVVPSNSSIVPRTNPADEDVIRRATGKPEEAPAPSPGSVPPASASVVATALGAMGTPYRWGGSNQNGFDCSGLIQYAFAQHGIELPRTSSEQARAGYEVGRTLDGLLPGDILTFSSDPGRTDQISHVGLYLGDGRFIHSANGGVQVSVLSQTDPASTWWFDRWVGARRVDGR